MTIFPIPSRSMRARRRENAIATSAITILSIVFVACPENEPVVPGGTPETVEREGLGTRDLVGYGDDLDAAVEIAPGVFQSRGTANAQMIVTSEGNVIFDTGLLNQPRVQELLLEADNGRITHLILSHAHADHYSAAPAFIQDGTDVIAHSEFDHNQRYLKELSPLFMSRNAIFFPEDTPVIPSMLSRAVKYLYPTVETTRAVNGRYAFELGGERFEVLAMPGAEGSDGLCLWMPDRRILFTGDLFGHIFPMWPNLTTIRGERARFPRPYIDSLNRILELDPVMLVPSHFAPITDRAAIVDGLTRTRDSVAYVEAAVIDGMNAGKDVYTLMREIQLPKDIAVPEVHGKVSWGVRGIWEAYTGWFKLDSSAELYAVPPSSVYAEVVAMAGGPSQIAARAKARLEEGQPVEALHLVDMAVLADAGNADALKVRLGALRELLNRSEHTNHYETMWLQHRIGQTQDELGLPRTF